MKLKMCTFFWLTLSWLLLSVTGADDIFVVNGQPGKCFEYFKDVFDLNHAQNNANSNWRRGAASLTPEADGFKSAKNVYPLAKAQLERRISTYEMQQRLKGTFEPASCSNYYCKAWYKKLEEMKNVSWSENMITMKTKKNAEKAFFRQSREFLRSVANTQKNYLETMIANASRDRMDVLFGALEEAANITKKGMIGWIKNSTGNTDSTDLIEILVTLSNEEKGKITNIEQYCKEMACNDEVEKNAPFSEFLTNLCLRTRKDDFDVNMENFADERKSFRKFIENPMKNYNGIAKILAISNYVHLRALNQDIKQHVEYKGLSGKGFYAWANYYNKKANTEKERHVWKLVKAIGAEIEFGRPRVLAEILSEKIEKILADTGVNDSFSDITRIVLTRAPLDLADINEAYEQISGNQMTLYDHLEYLKERKYRETTKNGYMTIESYQAIIEWAVKEMNHRFDELAGSTDGFIQIQKYFKSKKGPEFLAIEPPPPAAGAGAGASYSSSSFAFAARTDVADASSSSSSFAAAPVAHSTSRNLLDE